MSDNLNLQAAPEEFPSTQAPNIIALDTPRQRHRRVDVSERRFKLQPFANRTGSQSWRVSGTRRDGTRIRENFTNRDSAQCRLVELEAEFHAKQQESSLRATQLTDTQVKLAETAFAKLEADADILLAVDHWLKHGKQQPVADSARLDDAVKAFHLWLDATPSLRDHSKRNLKTRVNLFANSVGNLRVADITFETVENFLNRGTLSPITRDNNRRALSRFFSWCIERPRRWTSANPCRELRVEKGEKPPPVILDVGTCRMLMESTERFKDGRLVPYVAVCLFGGLRPFEASRLTWEAVNLDDDEIRLEGSMTKTGRPRVVAIDRTLKTWLLKFQGREFFPSNWRKDFDAVKRTIGFGQAHKWVKGTDGKLAQEATGLKPWPDDVMRHTAISHYFRHTGSYGRTAEQFGNSEAIIKAHYQGRVSSADTKAFYGLCPKKGGAK